MAQQIIKPGLYRVTFNEGHVFYLLIQTTTSGGWRMRFGPEGDLSSIPVQTQQSGFTVAKVCSVLEEMGFNVTHFEPDLIEIYT